MTGYENAWQASNISFSKWKQNVWWQPAIFIAHYICDQSKRWLAAGRSHRFFSFSISIFFKCIYFILFSFSRYGFIIITIIIILVVKIFISFVIYILLTIFFKLQHKSGQILCENARSPYLTDDICYLGNNCRTEQLFIS